MGRLVRKTIKYDRNKKKMSQYYKINDLKVRVSDHEPNYSMDRIRGRHEIEFYTKDVCNNRLSVIAQIEAYCDKHDIDISLFDEIAKDYPDEEMEYSKPEKITISQDILDGYLAITGKGAMRKKNKYCEELGIDPFNMSQGYYIII